jgi:PEP-CTERM motif
MRKSWLTAASAVAAVAAEAPPASAQLFTAPSSVSFDDTLVGSSTNQTFGVTIHQQITSGAIPGATAPFSGGPYSLVSSGKTQIVATYGFAPTVTGAASDILTISAVNLNAKTMQTGTITLNGLGVAPVESLSTSATPVARIGTSGLETVAISNTGDGNLSGFGDVSNLHGSLGASTGVLAGAGGSFDLTDSSGTVFDYNFTPTAHGTATGSVIATFLNGSADGKNQASIQGVSLSGQGVGPQYDSKVAPGGVIDLGTVKLGKTGMADLNISNISTDPTFGTPDLTNLSLLTADIQPSASEFAVENFVPDTVLGEGNSFDLKIDFGATSLGMQTAELVITTDQGAAFGANGQTFDYELIANVVPVPEPRTWEMLLAGFGLVGLQYGRSRRAKKADAKSG